MNNFNSASSIAIANLEINQYLTEQADAIALLTKRTVTQRKARYHDKTRIRRKDVQAWVFRRTGLSNTKEVKYYLKKLGHSGDARLTSFWVNVNLNYAESIADLVKTKLEEAKATSEFKVGDRVTLIEYSARLAHLESWSPFSVLAIADGIAKLELISFPVPVDQLQFAS